MVMCVCVDISPGLYLCVLHVLMVCSLCYIVVPTIWGGPPLCETRTYMIIYVSSRLSTCGGSLAASSLLSASTWRTDTAGTCTSLGSEMGAVSRLGCSRKSSRLPSPFTP